MQKITPFLWYSKEAEEAAAFYASIFPDSRVGGVTTLQSESPSGPPGSVKVVEFVLFGQPFVAMSAGPLDPFNHAVSFVVNCDNQAELDRYWNALLANGLRTVACLGADEFTRVCKALWDSWQDDAARTSSCSGFGRSGSPRKCERSEQFRGVLMPGSSRASRAAVPGGRSAGPGTAETTRHARLCRLGAGPKERRCKAP